MKNRKFLCRRVVYSIRKMDILAKMPSNCCHISDQSRSSHHATSIDGGRLRDCHGHAQCLEAVVCLARCDRCWGAKGMLRVLSSNRVQRAGDVSILG